jgi:hypothetical protein
MASSWNGDHQRLILIKLGSRDALLFEHGIYCTRKMAGA